jgi:hypothetical protein
MGPWRFGVIPRAAAPRLRYDPLAPWTAANQLGRDWCAQGADVEFRTNEEPPFE